MAANATSNKEDPPPPHFILVGYIILGSLVSFLAGREPGTLPENIPRELAPTVIVICGFLVSYNLWDCMSAGLAKKNYVSKKYQDIPAKMPEEAYLAVRVQTNQVEQMPGFIVGSLSCALFVNGSVAGVLALVWAILRRWYASVYRGSLGVPIANIGLTKFTVPAYFASSIMLMATAVHAARCLLL